jgi:hypothetical protein
MPGLSRLGTALACVLYMLEYLVTFTGGVLSQGFELLAE